MRAGGRTYAITAAPGDDGIQIMDITDPERPAPASAIFDDAGGFGALNGATDVEAFRMDGRTCGVVAAPYDDGIQMMDVADPARPAPVSAAFDGSGGSASCTR